MFIVIEGLDGAGKSTQVAKLTEYFNAQGKEVEYLHFPRFSAPVYGELIAKFLRGELGAIDQVDPQLIALIYAGDRADASGMIGEWLDSGKIVIVDRYVYSNIAYQCAKSTSQSALREWIFDLEYTHNNIPRPDLSIFLNVPFKFTESSLSKVREGDDRSYLNGKADIHEASLSFQERVLREYLSCEGIDPRFRVIDCSTEQGEMADAQTIFNRIYDEISQL
ncbi:MAG: dTMP kinase [Rikenellaceae bacterium]